jgi:hypothetical protein
MYAPNPSLQPTFYGWLRQPPQAAELKRWAHRNVENPFCMQALLAPVLLTLLLSSPRFVAAADEPPPARYSIKQDRPDPGSAILRDEVSGGGLPINRSYAELTPEQQDSLKSHYVKMGPNDEPPFPVRGLRGIYKSLAVGQQKLLVQGHLTMFVQVSASGEAVSVLVLSSPDPAMTKFAAAVLMEEKYKPALCDGVPCAMQFPFRIEFTRRW